jgi:hypothetical protein
MKTLRLALIYLLCTCFAAALCGCSAGLITYNIRKTYPGPELRGKDRQVLIVSSGGDYKYSSFISAVDGRDTAVTGESYGPGRQVFLLLPGTHSLEIYFTYRTIKQLLPDYYEVTLWGSGPKYLDVNLEEGHSYGLMTNIEFVKKQRHPGWEPYLEDMTGYPGFIVAEVPKRPYQFSLSAPGSDVNYIIRAPSPDKWFMHRRTDKTDFPVILAFERFTGKLLKTSYEDIAVVLDEGAIDPKDEAIDEVWVSRFVKEYVFREFAPRELPIHIESRQFIQIGGREYCEMLCQSDFRDAFDNEGHIYFRMCIPEPESSGEPSPIFVAFFGKGKDFAKHNTKTALDMISSMQIETKE